MRSISRHLGRLKSFSTSSASSSSSSSIDSREVRKFDNLNWWGKDGKGDDAAEALKAMHATRVKAIRTAIEMSPRMRKMIFDRPNGFSALDVGCGGGLMATSLKKDYGATRVMGIDASATGIAAATEQARKQGLDIDYRNVSPEQLDMSQNQFDLVCALEVVEHVTDRAAFLKSCARLSKGVLVVSTMDRTLMSWLLAIAAAEHVAQLVPKGTHDWRKFVSVREIEESIVHEQVDKRKRFNTECIIKLVYNPVTRSWSYSMGAESSFSPLCNYIYIASL